MKHPLRKLLAALLLIHLFPGLGAAVALSGQAKPPISLAEGIREGYLIDGVGVLGVLVALVMAWAIWQLTDLLP